MVIDAVFKQSLLDETLSVLTNTTDGLLELTPAQAQFLLHMLEHVVDRAYEVGRQDGMSVQGGTNE